MEVYILINLGVENHLRNILKYTSLYRNPKKKKKNKRN